MGAYFSDQHPDLVDEVIAQSEAIEDAGLRGYAEEHDMTIEACFETLLTGPGRSLLQRGRSLRCGARPRWPSSEPGSRGSPPRTSWSGAASTSASSRRSRPGAGQSAGRTRIFRHAHRRVELVERAVESRALWERWEEELGAQLLGREGMLLTGPSAPEVAGLLEEAGTPSRLLDEREQAEALPILAPPGGPARPRRARPARPTSPRRSSCSRARSGRGFVLAEVFAVDPGEPAVIETSEGIWEAGRAVLCAGAGIGSLAPELGIPVTLSCHARVTFRARDAGARRAARRAPGAERRLRRDRLRGGLPGRAAVRGRARR